MVAIATAPWAAFSQLPRPSQPQELNNLQDWEGCANAQAGYRFDYPSTWIGSCSDSVRAPSSLVSCVGLDCTNAMSFMVEKAPHHRHEVEVMADAGWVKSTVSCAGQQADAYTASDGSIHVWVRGPTGWFALHFHPLGDRGQAAPVFRHILATFAFIPFATSQNAYPPETALFEGLAHWMRHESGTGYFGCEDVCKQRPKRYRLFRMEADSNVESRNPSDVDYMKQLSEKVVEVLNANGWKKCKSVYDDSSGATTDTYSKDDSFITVATACSHIGGCAVNIAMSTSRLPEDRTPTPNPSVAITPNWKTYRNDSLGFEVSYPPNWKVVWVQAGRGAITTIGQCSSRNCLRMRLGVDQYTGDAFYVVITPKEDFEDTWTRGTVASYRIGQYPTREVQGQNSLWSLCGRGVTLLTTEGGYRYQFEPLGSPFVDDSFRLRDVFLKILSTVKINSVNQ